MNTTELEEALRRSAYIGTATAFPNFTQQVLLSEMTDKLQTVFEDIVVKARAGYWLQNTITTTVAGQSRYRVPPRAVVGGLEKVEIAESATGPWMKIAEVPASIEQDYRQNNAGTPWVFTMAGDAVDVIPTPPAGMRLRLTYYIRPSQLIPVQPVGVTAGVITAVNTTARTIVVTALPSSYASGTFTAFVAPGTYTIDVVSATGWHELQLASETATLAGTTFTCTTGGDMSRIAVGDYVRAADQSEWPCLPDDFHRCLADATAVKILIELNLVEKSAVLAANNGNDLQRFKSLLVPRVKAEPKQIGLMRRSRGYGWGSFR